MWRVIATDKDGREIARKEMDAGEFTIGRDQDRQLVLASPASPVVTAECGSSRPASRSSTTAAPTAS